MAPRLRAMDKDGDGKISRAEFPGPEPLFDRLDADKDGFIIPAETQRFFRQNFLQNAPRLRAMDKDGDGKISRAEFPGPKPLFDRLDADKDGFIIPAETQRFFRQNFLQNAPRLRAMDKDGDGKISRAEFPGPKPLFDRLDADKDGFIIPAETQRFFRQNFLQNAPEGKKGTEPKAKD